jgi:hypothetical protein
MRQAVHEEIVLQADSAFLQRQMHARRKNRHANPHLLVIFCAIIEAVRVESFLRRSNSPGLQGHQMGRQMGQVRCGMSRYSWLRISVMRDTVRWNSNE